ncbi:MAG: hypothetical protein F6K04_08245 [Leptolyngbya sp. SIO4C5]|nr:hypothetical protein [Leptolyngbya sp. SIO4C5]
MTAVASLSDKVYRTGRRATDEFKQRMPILFDEFLPQWSYVASPKLPNSGYYSALIP